MKISQAVDFKSWFARESTKSQAQILARLARIETHDHFGDYKHLGDDLLELRWKNGRRIYFTVYEDRGTIMLLLLGGLKNAQKKDIKKAKALIKSFKRES